MAKSRSLQQAVRFALATATAAAGVSALYAQEAPAPAAPVEEVVVTGSRLSTAQCDVDQPDHLGLGNRPAGNGSDARRGRAQ